MNSNIRVLCEKETNLSPSDIEHLAKIEESIPLYADLSQSYIFIDCMSKNNQHAIVVGEAFPEIEKAIYTNTVIGKKVFESFEPGVFYSYREGKKSIIENAINQEGRSVHQTVIPIKNYENNIIAVLIKEKAIKQTKNNVHFDESNLSIPTQLIDTILSTDDYPLPIVSDLLVEMFILTDYDHKLIYANPVGIKFISEMAKTNRIYQEDLTDLLPFLNDIYDKSDDVYVFERTIGKKSLVIKKIKLRQSDNTKNTLLIIQDLTELKMKDKELSVKSMMIQEIHHRVKNNLQTITSLLRLQMHQEVPEESYELFEDAINRIFSISAVYELILSSNETDTEYVNIIDLIRKICSKLIINSSFTEIDLIIRTNDNIIYTNQKKAISLALIVNELVQNSLKHAFSDYDEGEIIIEFVYVEDLIEVHIIDNGVGIYEFKPSLGLEIVRNLVENDLSGEFRFRSVSLGTHALISFNLSSEVGDVS